MIVLLMLIKLLVFFYCCTVHYGVCILFTHQQMHFLLYFKNLNLYENTHNYRSYIFRSSTILRELVQSLAKVTLLSKHSVKLRHCILCGDVATCLEMACVFLLCSLQSPQQTAHTPFHDMLPHLHTI
jgi:hypothetical protein